MTVFHQSCRTSVLALGLALLLVSGSLALGAELKKLQIAFPSYTMEQLPYQLAAKRGFFKEEGLIPELISMRSTTIAMALASQNLLYTSAGTTAIQAAVTGVNAKVLWVASAKTLMFLLVRPEIKQLSDLRNKRVGVSGIGGASDIAVRAMLGTASINPREVTIIAIGPTESRLLALKTGAIDATPLIPPQSLQAEALGFKNLGFMGDLVPNAFGGPGISSAALSHEAKMVEAVVRIGIKGLMLMKHDRSFTLKIMQAFTKIQDPELAGRTYDVNIGYFTDDGIISEKEQQGILEESKRELKLDKPIAPGIFDFSLAMKVKKELAGWRP
jgi:ABC-type nitrate/sulfonate/bicarbonate transport system substrate-binding protein